MSHIIVGNQLTNLTPDGPDWQQIEENQSGSVVSRRVTEKYRITRAAGLASIPAFASANGTKSDCLLRRVTEHTDKTGALWGVTLEFWNPNHDASTTPIAPGETIYELDQAWAQVPIEKIAYFATASPNALTVTDYAQVRECLTSGRFNGNSEYDGTALGDNDSTFIYEVPGIENGTWQSLTNKAQKLVLEKLKGNDYILRPLVVFRVTIISYAPDWPTLTANAGKRVITPVTVVTGSTADNWLYIAPRAERRKSNNQVFFSQSMEYQYNPDKWDTRFYA